MGLFSSGNRDRGSSTLLGLVAWTAACGNDPSPDVKRYAVCLPDEVCETEICQPMSDTGMGLCTDSCAAHADCGTGSFCMCDVAEGCTAGHCYPLCTQYEDPDYCRVQQISCPSDCAADGLSCQVVALSGFDFFYTCWPPIPEAEALSP
jgi:hypothetical protein